MYFLITFLKMSNSEESPSLSPHNVDESRSSLPTHEALSQPNPSPLNIDSSRGTKRKVMTKRSEVWNHFTKFINDEGGKKARCNYCSKEYFCDGKRNGTGSMKYHMNLCNQHPNNIDTTQAQLVLQSRGFEGEGNITNWRFDQKATRKTLACMIVTDELPFKFVESKGFRKFMSVACPKFHIPSRSTITRDIYQLYLDERQKLK